MIVLRKRNFLLALRFGLVLLVSVILTNCANETVPQGGKKDDKPPEVKKSSPPNKTLHFSEDKIQIKFNEYIKATGFAQTQISPPMDPKPDYKLVGKTLTVKFKAPLRDSTTYTINFAEDIKDVNEGNTASNFYYVFSTGSFLDSQKVSGKIILAKDNSIQDGIVVELYPVDSTDGILNSKPYYFAKSDKSGQFKFQNIKAGRYWVYALKDQNYNYIYDQPNELIGYSDTAIVLQDSLSPNLEIYLFEETTGKAKLDVATSVQPGLISIAYTRPVQSLKVESKLKSDSDYLYYNTSRDTISYWYSHYYAERTKLYLTTNDSIQDSTKVELKFIERDSLLHSKRYALTVVNQYNKPTSDSTVKTVSNVQELYKPLKINFSRALYGISEPKELRVTEDSGKISLPVTFYADTLTRQYITANFPMKENTAYTVTIPDSTYQDIFGTWNIRGNYKFQTNAKENYGNLHLTLKASDTTKNYIIKLLNSNNEVIREFAFSGAERKENVENLLAGDYKFIVIDDRNANGKWDTGNFKKKIQPEKIFTIKDTYQLKGAWDLDVDVKF